MAEIAAAVPRTGRGFLVKTRVAKVTVPCATSSTAILTTELLPPTRLLAECRRPIGRSTGQGDQILCFAILRIQFLPGTLSLSMGRNDLAPKRLA